MTKITIENEFGTYTIEEKEKSLNIHEMMNLVERVLLASSFTKQIIQDGFNAKASDE